MKTEELKKVLRHLIREEAKKIVAEEMNKAMGRMLVDLIKEVKSNNKETVLEEMNESEGSSAAILKTNNPKLNSVLAETARNFKPLQKTADSSLGLAELMDGGFDKIGQNESVGVVEPSTNMAFLKQMVGQPGPAVMNQPSALDGGAGVPDVLKKVFKKDFRAVMKRIDEQKKNGGGGYIDPTKVFSNNG